MLQLASLPGMLRIILIILVVYYGMKIVTRLFAPYFVRYLSKKAEKQFGQQFGNYQAKQKPIHKEGETVIDQMPETSSTSNKEVGDYVDYEEID